MPMIGPRRTMRSTRKPAGPKGLRRGSFRAGSSRGPRSCSIPRGPFRDLAELLQIRRDMVREDPGSRDEDVGAAPTATGRGSEFVPAINWELKEVLHTVVVSWCGRIFRNTLAWDGCAHNPGGY